MPFALSFELEFDLVDHVTPRQTCVKIIPQYVFYKISKHLEIHNIWFSSELFSKICMSQQG